MLYQDPAHRFSGCTEKVSAIFEAGAFVRH
jgi:hypothetical protein